MNITINLDTLDVTEDAPAFRDLDGAALRDVDAFITSGGVDVDEDEVSDIANIMANFEANPFG